MKPFQPRTLEQQKKSYKKACKRQMTIELNILREQFNEEHNRCAQLYHDKCQLEHRIDNIQDMVADAADKEFGGWDKWRHDDVLRVQVVKRMDEAVVAERAKIEEINAKMEKVMEPYRKACDAVTGKYYTLMRTA